MGMWIAGESLVFCVRFSQQHDVALNALTKDANPLAVR
jgi:hypothetical protein